MKLYPVTFVQLHNMMLMQGVNLGDKINAAQRGAKLFLDLEFQTIWVYFKDKLSAVPLPSVASYDLTVVPDHIKEALAPVPSGSPEPVGPPATRKRGRPLSVEPEVIDSSDPGPNYDPNDLVAAEMHRQAVRARSANAYKPPVNVGAQNDALIQNARMTAMGLKPHGKSAQVQTAQQVGEMTAVTGKKKIMSHAELQAQVAAETKPQ